MFATLIFDRHSSPVLDDDRPLLVLDDPGPGAPEERLQLSLDLLSDFPRTGGVGIGQGVAPVETGQTELAVVSVGYCNENYF